MSLTSSIIHLIRLLPGEDLRASIERYVTTHLIQAGWIVTCVGSLTDYNLRFANRDEGSRGSGHFEIVSLVGTLSVHGCHLHASLSDENGRVTGGHLLTECLVYTTAEIVIGESREHEFLWEDDGSTGYKELQIGLR